MKKYQAGFTLPEVVVSLVVASLVIGVLMNFAVNNIINYTLAEARADIVGQTQQALDIVSNDIRLSASADEHNRWPDVHAPDAPTNEYSWPSNDSILVLATVAEDDERNILFADSAQYISHKNNSVYFIQDGTLYKRVLAAPVADNRAITSCPRGDADEECPPDRELIKGVTSFAVRYYDASNVQVAPEDARSVELELTVVARKYGRDVSITRTIRTVFRNG